MPEPAGNLVGDRLHLVIGYSCNNNCMFCMEEDREARYRRLMAQTEDDVRAMMTLDPSIREVMFTSGEPTLHPNLPGYIAMAKDLGFEVIGLITNGRRFAYRPFLESLLSAGLNHVLVSIHGPNAHVHDGLVRAKGAFDQAMKGLANMVLLKRKYPDLKVHTSYVVNTRNLAYIREYIEFMRPFAIDQHVFNVMMPEGRGAVFFDKLMPRYSDVARTFAAAVASLPPDDVARMFLLDIPYCTTRALPESVRGYVERYIHYEPDATVLFEDGTSDVSIRPIADGETYDENVFSGENAEYSKVTKTVHDTMVRLKRPECAECAYNSICRGIFRIYIERFGWDEFKPG